MPCSLDLSEDFRLPFLTSSSPSDRLPRFVREHSRLFRLRHRFAGLAPFHVEQPCRKVGPLSSGFIFSGNFVGLFYTLSLTQVYSGNFMLLYLVISRYILSLSHIPSRFHVLARFIRRHFTVLEFYHFIPSGYYDVLLVFRAFSLAFLAFL